MTRSTPLRIMTLALALLPGARSAAQQMAPDAGVLELSLPPGATGTVNGKDPGDRRRFELGPLVADRLYPYDVVARFADGATLERRALLKRGWDVKLKLAPPDRSRPEIVPQTGHASAVTSTAISPDGRRVVTGSAGGTAILWEVATGAELRSFSGHAFMVEAVVFSPDGRRVLTASADHTTILWNVETGTRIRLFPENTILVDSAVFSPDGRRVLTASNDETAILWDAEAGAKVRVFAGHTSRVNSAGFSPDGRRVLTASNDKTAILWDAETGAQLRVFAGHTDAVRSIAFSPDGRHVLTASDDKTAVLWDAETGARPRVFAGHTNVVESAAFSPDGRRVLTASDDKTAVLWDAEAGAQLRVFAGHLQWLNSAAVSPDGRRVLTASWDGTAVLWDAETGTRLRVFAGHTNVVESAAFSPDGRRVLTASDDKTAVLWDAATGARLRVFAGHTSAVKSAAFSPDGRRVLTASWDRTAVLWDAETGARLRVFAEHMSLVESAAFSPDGRRVLTASDDKTAVIWDADTGARLRSFAGHASGLNSAVFSPDGRHVLIASQDDAAILDVETGARLRSFAAHADGVNSAVFSPDGRRVLTASGDGSTVLWDVATGDVLARMFSLDEGKDWLVVNHDGFFDGSAGGREKVMFRVGGGLNVVPVDRFFQDFYRPGLLAEAVRGERPEADVAIARSLPPKLRIVSPKAGAAESNRTTLEVEAVDEGGGVGNLALFQNGARVLAPGETRIDGKTTRRTFAVSLVEGDNRLKVSAATADGSWESEPAEVVLTYERPLEKSRLFLVAVGVNRYADAGMSLRYAAPDAKAFADLFRSRGEGLYETVEVATLIDEEATREAIHRTLKDVAARTRPQDTLALFIAGHGTMVGQRYYFVPHELRRKGDSIEEDVRKQGVPADSLSDDLGGAKALKRVMILDTCASGGALAVAMKTRGGFALRGAVERLSRTSGVFTIAASSASEQAQESEELGHGVLSYALLAGLKAVEGGPLEDRAIRPSDPDGVVDVFEWFGFAAGQVPRLTEKLYGVAQDVQTGTQGSSFPMLPVETR